MPWIGLLVLGATDCDTIPLSLACSWWLKCASKSVLCDVSSQIILQATTCMNLSKATGSVAIIHITKCVDDIWPLISELPAEPVCKALGRNAKTHLSWIGGLGIWVYPVTCSTKRIIATLLQFLLASRRKISFTENLPWNHTLLIVTSRFFSFAPSLIRSQQSKLEVCTFPTYIHGWALPPSSLWWWWW